jgi:glycosyltransferase involved in cell wall biosynthesis
MSSHPTITAVVCTRDRGERAVLAIQTILDNTHPSFELFLIDQSTTRETEQAVARFLSDHRFQYVHTATHGLGRARNIGLQLAHSDIVAFTDDDCSVPPHWLEVISATFARHPHVTVIFSNVEPGPHDATAGFIPAYNRSKNQLIGTFRDKCRARGIGASMAVRRVPILTIGGFDNELGVGSLFPSCEDADIAIRAIAMGQWVYETSEVAVIHYGYRTWKEGKDLAKRDWVGIGAAYVKPLKAGHWKALILVLYEVFVPCLLEPLSALLRLRPPRGLGRLVSFFRGFTGGLRQPIDRNLIVYRIKPRSLTPTKI